VGISTKTGDRGTTGLAGGARLPKDHPRIEALGALDELNAFLGDARAAARGRRAEIILTVQGELFSLSGILAAPPGREPSPPPDTPRLERWIHELEAAASPEGGFSGFVVPGADPLSAKLHIARTVCRRAERRLVSLARREEVPAPLTVYLNRLSDLLFMLARGGQN
jgi:cob(I)alamin adenosyltransferase